MPYTNQLISTLCAALLLAAGIVRADFTLDDEDIVFTPHAYGHLQIGQIVRGTGVIKENDPKVNNLWTQNAYTGLSLHAWYQKRFKMVFGVDVCMYFSYPQERNTFVTKYARQDVAMGPTYGAYYLDDTPLGNFHFDVGYFDFKYNPDVRNLGEFLFRSATYPAYIITQYDYPLIKLLGTRINHSLAEGIFEQDLILASETSFYPSQDWSLSYLLRYDIGGLDFIEIGAGGTLSHLLSVYDSGYDKDIGNLTDPKNLGSATNMYITEAGDTAYTTFRATKVMGRISLDPKFLIPGSENVFGEEDLKLYAEALLIGTKDYPDTSASDTATGARRGARNKSFERWQERIPFTFGVNLPAFKILDVFNLEFEWYGSRYVNDFRDLYIVNSMPISPVSPAGVTESHWKWSVYLLKTFLNKHTAISLQAARDHMRLSSADYAKANNREMLIEAGDWWWTIKTSYSF